jgi:hypothetical protein
MFSRRSQTQISRLQPIAPFSTNISSSTAYGTKRFHFALADGTDWDGLDFFSKEGYPDDLLALDVDHGEIILLGRESGEVWYNDGSSPFARRADARIDQGIAAAQTLVGLDNTRFWASRDRNGYGIMSRLSGYSPQRVSQFAIEYLLSKFGDISGGTAFTLQYGGHSLLVLNFPGATTTIVFDAATGAWHEWDYTKLPRWYRKISRRLARHERNNTYLRRL